MDIDCPEIVSEVTTIFKRYERGLVTNDVKTLNALFHSDPRTIRYAARKILTATMQSRHFALGARRPDWRGHC